MYDPFKKYRKQRNISVVIWSIFVVLSFILMFYFANKVVVEVKRAGLKNIVEEIWEGENKSK